MSLRERDESGFTLVELMIVVAIIGVLAIVAIIQYAGWIEKAAEGGTKAGLGTMRVSAAVYYGDHEGLWPTTLDDAGHHEFSRYIGHIAVVQVTGRFDRHRQVRPRGRLVVPATMMQIPTGQGVGWMYDSSTGNVYVNSTLRDSKAMPYSYYGFE
jgi:prepilin-type N-terminal cleavage/methylation domain-containing protein